MVFLDFLSREHSQNSWPRTFLGFLVVILLDLDPCKLLGHDHSRDFSSKVSLVVDSLRSFLAAISIVIFLDFVSTLVVGIFKR